MKKSTLTLLLVAISYVFLTMGTYPYLVHAQFPLSNYAPLPYFPVPPFPFVPNPITGLNSTTPFFSSGPYQTLFGPHTIPFFSTSFSNPGTSLQRASQESRSHNADPTFGFPNAFFGIESVNYSPLYSTPYTMSNPYFNFNDMLLLTSIGYMNQMLQPHIVISPPFPLPIYPSTTSPGFSGPIEQITPLGGTITMIYSPPLVPTVYGGYWEHHTSNNNNTDSTSGQESNNPSSQT